MRDLNLLQKKNSRALGRIKQPDERIRFIMDTIIPNQRWNILYKEGFRVVTYTDPRRAPVVSPEKIFTKLQFSFGVFSDVDSYQRGLAQKAMSELAFPDKCIRQPILFF